MRGMPSWGRESCHLKFLLRDELDESADDLKIPVLAWTIISIFAHVPWKLLVNKSFVCTPGAAPPRQGQFSRRRGYQHQGVSNSRRCAPRDKFVAYHTQFHASDHIERGKQIGNRCTNDG